MSFLYLVFQKEILRKMRESNINSTFACLKLIVTMNKRLLVIERNVTCKVSSGGQSQEMSDKKQGQEDNWQKNDINLRNRKAYWKHSSKPFRS